MLMFLPALRFYSVSNVDNYPHFINLFKIHSFFDFYLENKLLARFNKDHRVKEKYSASNSVNCADLINLFDIYNYE
jgi:hypothetical protein